MKTGDLVTLSAYGGRLAHPARMLNARKWKAGAGENRPLIGLVTEIKPPPDLRPWMKQDTYHIIWIGESMGLQGRESYDKFFYRKDLKMVSKA